MYYLLKYKYDNCLFFFALIFKTNSLSIEWNMKGLGGPVLEIVIQNCVLYTKWGRGGELTIFANFTF